MTSHRRLLPAEGFPKGGMSCNFAASLPPTAYQFYLSLPTTSGALQEPSLPLRLPPRSFLSHFHSLSPDAFSSLLFFSSSSHSHYSIVNFHTYNSPLCRSARIIPSLHPARLLGLSRTRTDPRISPNSRRPLGIFSLNHLDSSVLKNTQFPSIIHNACYGRSPQRCPHPPHPLPRTPLRAS